jgi:hypothetical protein
VQNAEADLDTRAAGAHLAVGDLEAARVELELVIEERIAESAARERLDLGLAECGARHQRDRDQDNDT